MRTLTLSSNLLREMDRVFDDLSSSSKNIYDEREFAPPTEINESEGHFLLSVDLPGIKKEDINIEVKDNILTLTGVRKSNFTEETLKTQRLGKTYGQFKRSFVLPNTVNTDNIEARHEDGVLELVLPKTPIAQPKKIEIQAGRG